VATYIRSAMNNSVSNCVIIEFSKNVMNGIEISWTYPYWCM